MAPWQKLSLYNAVIPPLPAAFTGRSLDKAALTPDNIHLWVLSNTSEPLSLKYHLRQNGTNELSSRMSLSVTAHMGSIVALSQSVPLWKDASTDAVMSPEDPGSEQSTLVASVDDHCRARLWEIRSGTNGARLSRGTPILSGGSVQSACWMPIGSSKRRTLLICTMSECTLLDLEMDGSHQRLASLPYPRDLTEGLRHVHCISDWTGRSITVAGLTSNKAQLAVWRLSGDSTTELDAQLIHCADIARVCVRCHSFPYDACTVSCGRDKPFHMATGDADGNVKLLRLLPDGTVEAVLHERLCEDSIEVIASSPSCERVAIVTASGMLHVFVHVLESASSRRDGLQELRAETVQADASHDCAGPIAWLDTGIGADMLAVSIPSNEGVHVIARSRPSPDEGERPCWFTIYKSSLGDRVNALAWCGQARLMVSCGSNIHLLEPSSVDDMFVIAVETSGPLPDHHPSCLFDWLLSGKDYRVRVVMRNLVRALRKDSSGDLLRDTLPLKTLLGALDSARTRRRSSTISMHMPQSATIPDVGNDGKDDDSAFDEAEADEAAECIARAATIPYVTNSDRIDILAALDALKGECGGGKIASSDLDVGGRHFLTSFRLSVLRLARSGKARTGNAVVNAVGKDVLWAFHSEASEALLEVCLPIVSSTTVPTFTTMHTMAASLWLSPLSVLQKRYTDAAWEEYKESKDPLQCAALYACLGKTKLLAQLFKKAGDEKVSRFLSRDFSENAEKRIAEKNAYQLMSKHNYHLSIALFFLAGSTGDAVRLTRSKLNDEQLALGLARLADGHHQTDTLKELVADILDPDAEAPPWKRHAVKWLIGEHESAIQELIHSQEHAVFHPRLCDLGDWLASKLFVKNRAMLKDFCDRLAYPDPKRGFLAYSAVGMPLRALEQRASQAQEDEELGSNDELKANSTLTPHGLMESALGREADVRVTTACCARGGVFGSESDLAAIADVFSLNCDGARERLLRLKAAYTHHTPPRSFDMNTEESATQDQKGSLSRRASMSSLTDDNESVGASQEMAPFEMSQAQTSTRSGMRSTRSESAIGLAASEQNEGPAGRQRMHSHGLKTEVESQHYNNHSGRPWSASQTHGDLGRAAAAPLRNPIDLMVLQDELVRSVVLSSLDSDEIAAATLRRGIICTNLRRALQRSEGSIESQRGRRNTLSALRLASTIAGDSFVRSNAQPHSDTAIDTMTNGHVPHHSNIDAAALASHPSKSMVLAASVTRSRIYALPFNDKLAGEDIHVSASSEQQAGAQEVCFDSTGDRFVATLSSGDVSLYMTEMMKEGPVANTHAFQRRAESAAFLTHSALACGGLCLEANSSVILWDPLIPNRSSGVLSASTFDVGCSSVATVTERNVVTACGLGGEVCAIDLRKARSGVRPPHPTARRGAAPELLWSVGNAHGTSVIASAVLQTQSGVNVLVTGCREGDVRLWDIERGECIHTYPRLHGKHTLVHPYGKNTVMQAGVTDIVPLEHGFLTCGGDGAVKLARFSKRHAVRGERHEGDE